MSFLVDISHLDVKTIQDICFKYEVSIEQESHKKDKQQFRNFTLFRMYILYNKKYLCLPFAHWTLFYINFQDNVSFKDTEKYTVLPNPEFKAQFREEQKPMYMEALTNLRSNHYCLLNLPTNTGKTFINVALITKLALLTVIVAPKTLLPQWVDEIKKFSNLRVLYYTGSQSFDDKQYDVILGTPVLLCKIPLNVRRQVGIMVYDEVHQMPTDTHIEVMYNYQPKYLITSTATYDRKRDKLEQILYYFTGEEKTFVKRFKTKKFVVVKYLTGIKPRYFVKGRGMAWDVLRESLIENKNRQLQILSLCKRLQPYKTLIMSDRTQEIESLYQLLTENGVTATTLYENQTVSDYDKNAQVLIAQHKKAGLGFSDSSYKALIITFSIKDVRQLEGRIRVDDNIVIDIVDDMRILKETHWNLREEWYKERCATIVNNLSHFDSLSSSDFSDTTKNIVKNILSSSLIIEEEVEETMSNVTFIKKR